MLCRFLSVKTCTFLYVWYPIFGWAKSNVPNVWAYCSACVDPISIIFLDMSCFLYSFEEYIKLNLKWVHFFRMNVHFCQFRAFRSHESNFNGVHCLWPLNLHLIWKNEISSFSNGLDTKHNMLKWTWVCSTADSINMQARTLTGVWRIGSHRNGASEWVRYLKFSESSCFLFLETLH